MWIADGWDSYKLIDAGNGQRLERWGDIVLIRPDPQAVWHTDRKHPLWHSPHAVYHRSDKGGGRWEMKKKVPESWLLPQDGLTFRIKPMGFKHTGLFPEQLVNWRWFGDKIRRAGRPVKVLNLFAYTGGATVAAAAAGASVCHVDASKGMVTQAKENAHLSGLADHPIRYIVDDCSKFVQRELRRGNRYDGIILDPPSYGRGAGGEVWKLEDALPDLLDLCAKVLSDDPLFVLLNSYTTGLSAQTMANLVSLSMPKRPDVTVRAEEIGLPIERLGLPMPCGSSVRWEVADR